MDQVVQLNAVPNDPDFHRLWALEKIRTLEAWSKLKSLGLYGEETVVAVIDTGVQLDHPDLKDSLWRNVAEIPNNGIDDDGNGYVDDVHGYDFAGASLRCRRCDMVRRSQDHTWANGMKRCLGMLTGAPR